MAHLKVGTTIVRRVRQPSVQSDPPHPSDQPNPTYLTNQTDPTYLTSFRASVSQPFLR